MLLALCTWSRSDVKSEYIELMGSCGSKGSCRGGASSLSGGRKGISIGKNRVFQSSCLGAISGSADSHFDRQVVVVDHHNKDYGSNFTNQNSRERESVSDQVKRECSRKVEAESASDYEMPLPCISSNGVDIDASRSGSSSGRATTAVHHSPSRCLSGFSFFSGNISFAELIVWVRLGHILFLLQVLQY
ncbi:hypothetical protein ES332_D08G315000v1 [Gossypium tomentosum]|nr:hypothetical protein ES332_D08G315000v1 [Gossypium tomentosum]